MEKDYGIFKYVESKSDLLSCLNAISNALRDSQKEDGEFAKITARQMERYFNDLQEILKDKDLV
ncbi:hypothetical protein [Halalkalibacter hemicellulosilyticus]|uniref:Uncharacterized protein n=1 Tax=Halalkalibacter hemicellulosilyticusJCM 9152 TaxID=1236971 RepID=W4QL65_9BACI|nr:hypothetical protein [Halalkalibacter hemicellulosilyticus]GAE32860.1 hypothetical protein JCM9152_4447 [Halalkalibacter hemicellulosilyticusJCM 9152]